MKAMWLWVAIGGAAACSYPAVEERAREVGRSDVILQWNEQVVATGGLHLQRTLAMVHVAMFDAANAVAPRYHSYLDLPPPPAPASVEAAAAGAAHGVLIRLFPDQGQPLAAALARSLATVPDGPAETNGVRYGDLVAKLVHAARLDDRMLMADAELTSASAPGAYQLTAEYQKPINTRAREWVPFVLSSASQFRPPGPNALESPDYARDLTEVREVGSIGAPRRSREQEQMARWHTEHGDVQFNRIARSEAAIDGHNVVDHARLFALLNVAIADAAIGVFEAKYTYRFWRPVTAIRRAGEDGNSATEPDVVWSAFLPTPPHPEYPSAHSAIQAAASRVLTAYFGPSHPFETTSRGAPGVTRRFESFDAFAKEGGESGILAGVHFRTSVDHGRTMGERIAEWVLEHCLRPK